MTVIAFQGLRGGTGASSLTAAFAWALSTLGEKVIAIDLSSDNLLRMHFNMPAAQSRGWLRAALDGLPWQQSALRYTPHLDFVPAGQLTASERMAFASEPARYSRPWAGQLAGLGADYPWILLDVPAGDTLWTRSMLALADRVLSVVEADANCHVRLHQQSFAPDTLLLLNRFSALSKAQQDLHQLWSDSLNNLIPVTVHRDEAVAESLLNKQPVGEYRPLSLAAESMITFANWALINLRKKA